MSEMNFADIITGATAFASSVVAEQMKSTNDFSAGTFLQVRKNILKTQYADDYVVNVAVGAVMTYHNQLREVLLEKAAIDIGEFET